MHDITTLKSHPDKFLLTHVAGVIKNVKKLTDSKWGELLAIFHDLGKVNPNFQNKLYPNRKVSGYSNHAYLSAYAFFCAFAGIASNKEKLKGWLLNFEVSKNDLIALTVLIAKHHGNLPDFCPEDQRGTGASILSKIENDGLYSFLNLPDTLLPVNEFSTYYFQTENYQYLLNKSEVQKGFSEQFIFDYQNNKKALDFFLDTQHAFACLIQADKADAAKFDNFIDDSQTNVQEFCNNYQLHLQKYLSQLIQDSELNKLRTKIREEAISAIQNGVKENIKVFELTAPTGSGKTLMLLSLASEIMKANGDFRIIYSLPFLSITEQVEAEVLKIFSETQKHIQRIDSKSQNERFEELQAELDNEPSEEKIQEINLLEFQENTFAYPFVITTFVRFFETLLSNRNSELLKLPNFSRCIFLIDEIQTLPPRLYGFFVAYLAKFCEKFNSYAIISTATQPNFELPRNSLIAQNFFYDYKKPHPLLSLKYFENDLFNRYKVNVEKELIDLVKLRNQIIEENNSVLVILNTIDDTKDLHNLMIAHGFSKDEVLLLNTHFIPQHRKLKIYLAKRRLRQNKKIILISTQLIEAGVDIDFPVLYRDFATVASVVQSSGRCNRNGKLSKKGIVKLFRLKNRDKIRSELIYQGRDKDLLTFTKDAISNTSYQEKDIIDIQKNFFNRIQGELNFAKHSQSYPKLEFDFLKDIQQVQFDKIGKFQLIDKILFGEEIQYFVPKNNNDKKFESLLAYQDELFILLRTKNIDKNIIRLKKKKIKAHMKAMANQIVQIRLSQKHIKPTLGNQRKYFELFQIALSSYSFEKGVDLRGDDCII